MILRIEVIHEHDGETCSVSLVSIRGNQSPETYDWIDEEIACGALGEFGFWKRMKPGERVRQRLKVRLWSNRLYDYYYGGYEYETGIDILAERTFKRHKSISDKAWHRKHYHAKGT